MKTSAIVLAAGFGTRMGGKVSKPLLRIGGKPVIAFSLEVLSSVRNISEIVVVANDSNLRAVSRISSGYRKVACVVTGGARRQDSVEAGLRRVSAGSRLVLVHDSARPFITVPMVKSVIALAASTGAAIAGVPVKATIKEAVAAVRGKVRVRRTYDRDKLWEVQTPQVFRKDWLEKAYARHGRCDFTDDAGLIEASGKKVYLARGSYYNIKITTQEDLVLAEGVLKAAVRR
jgi:2-C-methyl-D-erythritol 4-phosphate cytidylyltransferase